MTVKKKEAVHYWLIAKLLGDKVRGIYNKYLYPCIFPFRKAKQLKSMKAPAFWWLTASAELTTESRVWDGKSDNSLTCVKQISKLLHQQALEQPCGRNGANGERLAEGAEFHSSREGIISHCHKMSESLSVVFQKQPKGPTPHSSGKSHINSSKKTFHV